MPGLMYMCKECWIGTKMHEVESSFLIEFIVWWWSGHIHPWCRMEGSIVIRVRREAKDRWHKYSMEDKCHLAQDICIGVGFDLRRTGPGRWGRGSFSCHSESLWGRIPVVSTNVMCTRCSSQQWPGRWDHERKTWPQGLCFLSLHSDLRGTIPGLPYQSSLQLDTDSLASTEPPN